ncbi:MAG: tRNA (N6-isopentenyl adenosine(37)-C2)-methylthiotransferase MiaB [Eubacteriales bacterium]|nr:tRNA (N6-isopentenyl adenosine(37)-C2)-methylthiotransferase MiaB [Eubacteriales bacterium]MDD4629279.1 tRNA (N6-isopentenyl adenosine(37)-C2)-methylthiotransferase MiaB [Eubacteriales bacterium]
MMDKRSNLNKGYNITTFGCQMNEHDSETLAGMLEELGYIENANRREADVAIINTCSVRENADKRFFGTLGQLKKVKEERPETVVAVCGCMMQQQHIIDTLKAKYPWVDLVFGTHNIHQFPSLLNNVLNERNKVVDVWDNGGDIIEGLPAKRMYPFKAYVNIMYGCNNFCTYCIVPYTRGRERSRHPGEIVNEVKALAASGVKEITLLGQNVNSYGKGSNFTQDFADLIYMLNDIDGIERIRFMTSHPKDLSNKLIHAFQKCDKLCNSIHLPVQSGSTEILTRMNRKYSKEDYLQLIEKLRDVIPDIAITTDIIVGFPGESDEDFNETMDLVEKVRFDSAFTFLYSIRKGTPAEKYKDQVPESIKHQRFDRLVDRLNEISQEINKSYEGNIVLVLAEGSSKTNTKMISGRTVTGKLVNFKGPAELTGKLVPIRITEGKTFSLNGDIEK